MVVTMPGRPQYGHSLKFIESKSPCGWIAPDTNTPQLMLEV
jgi:hypothetical protein